MVFKALLLAAIAGVAIANSDSDFEKLADVDSEFYTPPQSDESPRVARQIAGTDTVCVPNGMCIGGNTINPRIVVGGGAPPVCPTGFTACTGSAAANTCGVRHVTNVATGDGTTSPGAYPWQVFIRSTNGYVASGVLIDQYHVLTAAHKFPANPVLSSLVVHMGVHNPLNLINAVNRTVARYVSHVNFSNYTLMNDIAVIRLSSPVIFGYYNNIGTACLPPAGTNSVGLRCTISGWGTSAFAANDAATTAQKQVSLPIVSYSACRAAMQQSHVLGSNTDTYLDPNGELCAGGEAFKDACTHDGGSPLVCTNSANKFYVAGLAIWGVGCGQIGVPGVYVDISKYITWINNVIATFTNGGTSGVIDPRTYYYG